MTWTTENRHQHTPNINYRVFRLEVIIVVHLKEYTVG